MIWLGILSLLAILSFAYARSRAGINWNGQLLETEWRTVDEDPSVSWNGRWWMANMDTQHRVMLNGKEYRCRWLQGCIAVEYPSGEQVSSALNAEIQERIQLERKKARLREQSRNNRKSWGLE